MTDHRERTYPRTVHLAEEAFEVRYMVPSDEAALFHAEAALREHVKDRDGAKHDVVMLSHDVNKFLARMEVFGLTETS